MSPSNTQYPNSPRTEMIRPKTLNEVLEEHDDRLREEDPDYRAYNEMTL